MMSALYWLTDELLISKLTWLMCPLDCPRKEIDLLDLLRHTDDDRQAVHIP